VARTLPRQPLWARSLGAVLRTALQSGAARRAALTLVDRALYNLLVVKNAQDLPLGTQFDKYTMARNLLWTVDRALASGRIAEPVRDALVNVMLEGVLLTELPGHHEAIRSGSEAPPGFLTISPTGRCNLRCKGCYAGSSNRGSESLPYPLVSRVVEEKTRLWGSHFTVVSGGEPFLWRDGGKDLVELARQHSDNLFLVYTNGTLIDEALASRLAQVGNISPAISVEGLEKETDERRGKGCFSRILGAFHNLREAGVPFGVSLTATRGNAEVVLAEETVDFYFRGQGALYAWVFQYMPIGKSYKLREMVTPEQRVWMLRRFQQLIREEGLFIADFWNGGPVSDGCISAGRSGGYLYIDWQGNVTPCVFFPYASDNIRDVYASGRTLDDVIESPLFVAVRTWQKDYSYCKPAADCGNQLLPCAIRDHHGIARAAVVEHHAKPINEEAADALEDEAYARGLIEYGRQVAALTDPIWREEYVQLRLEDVERPSQPGGASHTAAT
jgi:MoaA/NifB/PqqE/SkfB family radical SAM enzyme